MRIQNAFIIHGIWGKPGDNWFPWLKEQLSKKGIVSYVPQFPAPPNHNLDSWLSVFQNYLQFVGQNTIMVGHSMAPAFLLSVLERITSPVAACFLVAPFIEPVGVEEVDKENRSFLRQDFDWHKIRRNSRAFYLYCSDNDPYVPVEKSRRVAEMLGTSLTMIKNAGHFNTASGYTTFPQLLKDIEAL